MDESEFGKLARQGLNIHLEYVRRRTEILAMLDRISLVLREEFQIPDLELRFRADGGSGNSRNEGSLRFVCMKTTKDRKQLSLQVAEFVLPSEQGEDGRLGDDDFATVEDFQQLLADEMKRPRFGVLLKQLLDSCRFDAPKPPDPVPPDPIGNRNFIPPPTEDPADDDPQ
jgi:hypothetical protein